MNKSRAEEVYDRVQAYRKRHPEATWAEVWAGVPNHYSSMNSLFSGMRGVERRRGVQAKARGGPTTPPPRPPGAQRPIDPAKRYGGLPNMRHRGMSAAIKELATRFLFSGARGCIEGLRLVADDCLEGDDLHDHETMLQRLELMLGGIESRLPPDTGAAPTTPEATNGT